MTELQFLNIIISVFFAVLGASFASFLNVAALRRAGGLNFVSGRSSCPFCKHTIKWFDLIPVISWLLLRGRCRECKTKISPRYLLVELVGAAIAMLCFIRFWLTWMTPLSLAVAILLYAVALIDLGTQEIPNGLVLALIPFAIASVWAMPEVSLLSRGIGLLTASLPMFILALLIEGAFGFGDVKLMAVCGVLLGWQNTVLAFFIAVVTAGCYSLVIILRGAAKKGAKIAFGPHLFLGVYVALLCGSELISWYLKLFGL